MKNLHVMNVEFYDGVGTTLDMPVMLPPVPSAVDFSAQKVLIADDVADSGRTIELVYTFIKDHVEEVRSAVIYEKPRSLIKCDYVSETHLSLDQLPRGAARVPSSNASARSSTPDPAARMQETPGWTVILFDGSEVLAARAWLAAERESR